MEHSFSAPVTADGPQGQEVIDIFRARYNEAGLDEDSAKRLNANPDFAEYLAEGIRRFSAGPSNYALARSILGADFITPEGVMSVRNAIAYSEEQVEELNKKLPPTEVLWWCKENGYAVMPAPPTPMSTLDVRKFAAASGWYHTQGFAREDKTSFGWLMVKKTPVEDSMSKSWREQIELLGKNETVPNAAEMFWFISMYLAVRDIKLFEGVYVRTSSVDPIGDRAAFGFGPNGFLYIYIWDPEGRDWDVGLSAARKWPI